MGISPALFFRKFSPSEVRLYSLSPLLTLKISCQKMRPSLLRKWTSKWRCYMRIIICLFCSLLKLEKWIYLALSCLYSNIDQSYNANILLCTLLLYYLDFAKKKKKIIYQQFIWLYHFLCNVCTRYS